MLPFLLAIDAQVHLLRRIDAIQKYVRIAAFGVDGGRGGIRVAQTRLISHRQVDVIHIVRRIGVLHCSGIDYHYRAVTEVPLIGGDVVIRIRRGRSVEGHRNTRCANIGAIGICGRWQRSDISNIGGAAVGIAESRLVRHRQLDRVGSRCLIGVAWRDASPAIAVTEIPDVADNSVITVRIGRAAAVKDHRSTHRTRIRAVSVCHRRQFLRDVFGNERAGLGCIVQAGLVGYQQAHEVGPGGRIGVVRSGSCARVTITKVPVIGNDIVIRIRGAGAVEGDQLTRLNRYRGR